MKQFFSGLSFLVQAIIVVAVVLIFAYFDPFGLFSNNKLTLRDTPAQVQQIKAIGELVSAEYYGEVISSYKNIVELQINDAEARLLDNIHDLDSSFKTGILKIKDVDKDQSKEFDKLCDSLSKQDNYFNDYLDEIRAQLKIKWYQGRKKLLEKLLDSKQYDNLVQNTLSYCNDIFQKKKNEVTKSLKTRKIRKSQLILLGRGKVQAGFRFNKLNDRNVKIDTIHNRIILTGMKPEILSCDINPWFIPELGMKGFEIIDITGKLDKDVNVLRQVKKNCLDSLRANALNSNILGIAKENAEQNLKQLFSLLLNKTVEVKIVANELDYYIENIFDDSLLSPCELMTLDSLTDVFLTQHNDSDKVFALMDSIKHCRLAAGKSDYSITPFTLPTLKLLQKNLKYDTAYLKSAILTGNCDKWIYIAQKNKYSRMDEKQSIPLLENYKKEASDFYKLEYDEMNPKK